MNKKIIKMIVASGFSIMAIAIFVGLGNKGIKMPKEIAANSVIAEEVSTSTIDFVKEKPIIASVINNKNSITIKWNKLDDATGYYVYRDGKKIGKVKKQSKYTDKKANKNGSLYTFSVKAYKIIDGQKYESEMSPVAKNYFVKGNTIDVVSGNINVSWHKNSKVSGYQIQYSTKKNFKNAKIKTVNSQNTICKT